MGLVVTVGRRARLGALGVVLALGLGACAVPPGADGGNGGTSTTAPATTVGPSTTAAGPTTTSTAPATTSSTAAPTTTTTAPPAGQGFGDAVSVSTDGYDSRDEQVAVDRQGDAVLVWVRTSHEYPYPSQVELRSRSHTGAWGPIVVLTPADQAPHSPMVAVDDDGDAVVSWTAITPGPNYGAYARRVSGAGTVGPLQTLSGPGVTPLGTRVTVDADGDAVVTWAETHTDGGTIPKMRRFARDGSLGAEEVLSTSPARAEVPAVAVDQAGDGVVAWTNDWVVQARTLTASGPLGPLETVSPDLSPIDRHLIANVTVDRDGDALVTWRHHTQADGSEQVWGRWLSHDGTVGAVRQLTPAAHPDISNYSIAGDPDGDILLTWDRFPSKELYVRRITPAGTLGEPVQVASIGRLPTVRIDDGGEGIEIWQGESILNSIGSIRVRRVSPAGELGPEQILDTGGDSPTVGVGPEGGAVAAWERGFQFGVRIQASADPR